MAYFMLGLMAILWTISLILQLLTAPWTQKDKKQDEEKK